jgi:hypothetical protein
MSAQFKRAETLARLGLRLPSGTLKRLQSAGIFCQPAVSVYYQQHAHSYVLRAVESGGAIAEFGAYCGFVDADGNPLTWSERVDGLAVNGLHAIVVAPALIRLEMVRNRLSYELLISRHSLFVQKDRRPQFQSSILFHGHGAAMAVNDHAEPPGKLCPSFGNRSGQAFEIPTQFRAAVQRLVAAVWCVGCGHCHLSQTASRSSKRDSTNGV